MKRRCCSPSILRFPGISSSIFNFDSDSYRLILKASRWLNRVEEEDELAQALIDIMIGCSSFIQVLDHILPSAISNLNQEEVISALPEILPDSQHPAMAVSFEECSFQFKLANTEHFQVHLNSMLDEVRPHTAAIVDCLTNLTLSREATKQVGISDNRNFFGSINLMASKLILYPKLLSLI